MYESILVPTDGSDPAKRAAEHAASLATAIEATIHVLHVIDLQAAAGPFSAGGVDEEFLERLEADGEDAIDQIEEVATDRGVASIETEIRQGKPTETIVEYAEAEGMDAIAMGTHGRTGIEHYVTGSVTEHVVRFADVPVLTARATEASQMADGYDEVLLPTDGSEYAAVAYDHGIAVAEALGARVHAVNVVNSTDLSAPPAASPSDEVHDEFQTAGEEATATIASMAEDAGLEAVTAVREGAPPSTILEYAAEQDVDLIAMGTAGRTGPNRYLLGSTTERIIRHADVPVLAVNARGRSETGVR